MHSTPAHRTLLRHPTPGNTCVIEFYLRKNRPPEFPLLDANPFFLSRTHRTPKTNREEKNNSPRQKSVPVRWGEEKEKSKKGSTV